MAVKSGNERIQVTISKELIEKVRKYSGKIGLSVSAFISFATAEKIMQYEKAYEIIDKYADVVIKDLKEGGKDAGGKD